MTRQQRPKLPKKAIKPTPVLIPTTNIPTHFDAPADPPPPPELDAFDDYNDDFEDFNEEYTPRSRIYTPDSSLPLKPQTIRPPISPEPQLSPVQEFQEAEKTLEARHDPISLSSFTIKKQSKRAKDLLEMISLDVSIFDVFDLPPLNEYELYIRDYGSSNTVQQSTQWNQDHAPGETQTDDWLVETKWTQAPLDTYDCGSGPPPDVPSLKAEYDAYIRTKPPAPPLQKFLARVGPLLERELMHSAGAPRVASRLGRGFDATVYEGPPGSAVDKVLATDRGILAACYTDSAAYVALFTPTKTTTFHTRTRIKTMHAQNGTLVCGTVSGGVSVFDLDGPLKTSCCSTHAMYSVSQTVVEACGVWYWNSKFYSLDSSGWVHSWVH